MARDELKKRIEELNRRPLGNVPNEEKSEIGGLRRKLKKQADAKLAKLTEDKVIFPMSEAPAPGDTATLGPSTGSELRKLPDSAPSGNSSGSRLNNVTAPEPVVYARSAPQAGPPRSVRNRIASGDAESARDSRPSVALEDVVDGIAAPAPVGGEYYHIELAADRLDPCACEMHACFTPLLGHPVGEAIERIAATCKAERIAPEEIVFLDLETTGLSMTPVFLIGTMECTCDGFVFKQYFARDYSEEACILSAFSQKLGDARMIVTFNGKSFDMPFLQNRAVATGIKLPMPHSHLDLLHESRRHYGRKMPNHKLQTLEQIVCGRRREDDIPGSQIPAAYHEFVRTGNARKIGSILTHNLHDLLTMADLMGRMWQR